MSRIIKWIGIPVLAIALVAAMEAPKAEAGNGFSLRIGGFGISTGHHGYHRSYRSAYQPRVYNNYRSYNHGIYGHRGFYHDTTHLHYHRPQLVPHNGHLDYVPGHYDVHRTGHWHH